MAFQFLTPENIKDTYVLAKQYTESLTYPWFLEYERIARNEPHPSLDKKYPKTTDGTTASVIRKTPHRIVQQIPTGTVKGDTEDWLTLVASFIYTHKILPYANSQYSLIQKCWATIEKALTFGSVATYTPFLNHDGYMCPDLTLIYWGDIAVQPGKLSDKDSNYIFMRSWWRKADVEALIERETKQTKRSKSYQSTWNLDVLRSVLNNETTKDVVAQTPVEREKAVNTKGAIELITGFQRGVGGNFYTFAPNLPAGENIVRTKENKDPRGELPIQFMYADVDGSNPLGRGVVEMVGGLQNLMDAEMQMYQYNRALMLNPPLVKWGNFNKNRIKFEPNIIIDVGSDPTAKVEPLLIDSSAIANFPTNLGTMRNQLLTLLQSPNTDLGAAAGNSKTPQGVVMTGATISVDDNYYRKQFEAWFERWSETAINLYFAERTGIEELQLDEDTAEALRNLDGFDQTLLSPDDKIRINYNTATPALKFRVDPSSSQMKDDPQQLAIATNLLELAMKFPQLNSKWGGAIEVDDLARKIVRASAIQDPEAIAPEPTQAQKQAAQQQKVNGFSPLFDKPKISIAWEQLPPAAQVQVLALAGVTISMADALEGPVANINARGNTALDQPLDDPSQLMPDPSQAQQQQADQQAQQAQQQHEQQQQMQVTPDHILKADQQGHQQAMDKAKLLLEIAKTKQAGEQHAAGLQAQAQAAKLKPKAKP